MPGAQKPFARIDLAALVLVAVVWGVNNLAAKHAVASLPPLFAAGVRFAVVSLVLIGWLRPVAQWRMLAGVALLGGPIHFGIQNLGLALARNLTPMVIAMQLWIPCSALFAALALGERIGWRRGGGIAAAFAGVAVLAFDASLIDQITPLALIATAAAAYGASAVLVRRAGPIHPLTFQAWIALACWPCLLLASATFEPDALSRAAKAPWTAWAALAFGAFGSSIVANALMFSLVQRYEVSRTTPFLFLSPVVGIGLGITVLGDPATPRIALGAGLTILGVALAALAERRPAR